MFQIDTSSATGSLPTPSSAGTAGYFTGGNVLTGVTPTVVSADFLNGIQGELASILKKASVSQDKAAFDQVLASLSRLGGWHVTTLTATGTLTLDQMGLVMVDASGGNVTLTLPSAAALNAVSATMLTYRIVRTDGSANTVTISRAGSDTIEGNNTLTIASGGRVTLTCDGVSKWYQTATGAISGVALLNTTNTGTLGITGAFTAASVVASGNLTFSNTNVVGTNALGARTVEASSAGVPTGGNVGDIHFQY